MKKLLILILFLFSLTLQAQLIPGIVASQGGVVGCGTGTSNYGDESATSSLSTYSANYVTYVPVTVSACGGVITYHAFVGGTASTHVKFALYTDNAGVPGSLVANSETGETSESTAQWNTYTALANPHVLAGNYWVASLTDANHNISSTGGALARYRQTRTYADGFPATATPVLNISDCNTNTYIVIDHTK